MTFLGLAPGYFALVTVCKRIPPAPQFRPRDVRGVDGCYCRLSELIAGAKAGGRLLHMPRPQGRVGDP